MQSTPPDPVRDATASGSLAQPRQRWAWTYRYGKPLLVASIVAVVLTGTGLVAAILALGGEDEPGGPSGPDCVVGTWRIVESEQYLSGGLGTVILADDGPRVRYQEDGTGTTDYRDGVAYQVVDSPGGIMDTDMVISGRVTYDYVLDGGTIRYRSIDSDLTQSNDVIDLPTTLSSEAYDYQCEADTMSFRLEGQYEARLERLDS